MQASLRTWYQSARSLLRRSREEDDDDGRSHAPQQPPFVTLTDIVHDSIASFLGSTSLQVSEVSHALLEFYGGTLTSMQLHYVEESRAGQPAHNSIAAFLGSTSRRVSEISHALSESYGGTLTSMHLR